jgi:FkbM family methyltransferase
MSLRTALGILVVAALAALAAAGLAGRERLATVYSLALANWHSDLRDGVVGSGNVLRHLDRAEFERTSHVVRTEGGLTLWKTRIGEFWMPPDEGAGTIAEMAEIVEGDTYKYRGRTVRAGDIVIDCGAHLGSFVRRSLQLGARLVVAIEPSSAKIVCMQRTFASEIAEGRVRLVQMAVWDQDDRLWLSGVPLLTNAVSPQGQQPGQDGEWVGVTTLDKIVEREGLDAVDFVKMDIEGAEVRALEGARTTIHRYRPFLAIAVEHTSDLSANARNVIRTVESFGLGYRHGFGRYGKLRRWAAYTPWEVFFFTEDSAR